MVSHSDENGNILDTNLSTYCRQANPQNNPLLSDFNPSHNNRTLQKTVKPLRYLSSDTINRLTVANPLFDYSSKSVAVAPLGSIVNSSSKSLAKLPNKPRDTIVNARYRLHRTMRRILLDDRKQSNNDSKWRSVLACHHNKVPNFDAVSVEKSNDATWFSGLMTCKNVWNCPHCSEKITMLRRNELAKVVSSAIAMGLSVIMVTLTQQHNKQSPIDYELPVHTQALKLMFGGRKWELISNLLGIVGQVRAQEVTHGENGWHVHSHVLMFLDTVKATSACRDEIAQKRVKLQRYTRQRLPKSAQNMRNRLIDDIAEIDAILNELACLPSAINGEASEMWGTECHNILSDKWKYSLNQLGHDCTKKNGLSISVANSKASDYIAKFGTEMKDFWSIESEMTRVSRKKSKGGLTMFEMLAKCDDKTLTEQARGRFKALWLAYAIAMKGKRQLVYSKGLRAKLGLDEAVEDEALDLMEAGETVYEFTHDEYVAVVNTHSQPLILSLASQEGGAAAVARVARECVVRWAIIQKIRNGEKLGSGQYLHQNIDTITGEIIPVADVYITKSGYVIVNLLV